MTFGLKPLEINEFIGPLSRTHNVSKEEFQQWSSYTDELLGHKAKKEAEAAASE